MTQKNVVGWFEIPTLDLDRAEKFYGEVFGYAFTRQPEKDGYTMSWFPPQPMVEEYGSAGTLMEGPGYVPSHDGIMIYFSVDDIPATLAKVTAAGGNVLQEKMSIGEHGFIGTFEDSEGNKISIHSMNG